MKTWWQQTSTLERLVLVGVVGIFMMLGMYTWVWTPLNQSIERISHDLTALNQKNLKTMEKISLLRGVKQEVATLREKLLPHLHPQSVNAEPQSYRRDVVAIGMRNGLSVLLWKPKQIRTDGAIGRSPLSFEVRVEGKFFDTVQFLDELSNVSWVRAVNPLTLARKHQAGDSGLVTTDFVITAIDSKGHLQAEEALDT